MSKLELQWPGKEDARAQASMPAALPRLVEQVASNSPSGNVTNRLIQGDNLGILLALAEGERRAEIEAAGGIRLIYLDPPFATGDQFHMDVLVGDAGTTVRLPVYGDAWEGGLPGYLSMLAPRLRLLHDLLAADGSLYFHCDYRASAGARLLLDEIFGPDRLLNEIVWSYGLGNANQRRAFGRKHDTILLYTKSEDYLFNLQRGDVTPAMAAKYRHRRPDGTRFMRSYGKEYDLQGGKPLGSVWDIPAVAAMSRERVGYPTQKPEALLSRIIAASSNPGDLVLDPFCGAGTTLAVADRLGRRWIGCDASRLAIWTTRKRLAGGAGFDLLVSTAAEPTPPMSYILHPTASVEQSAEGPRLRLQGLEVIAGTATAQQRSQLAVEDGRLVRYVRTNDGKRCREAITRHWSDWLDGWAIGTCETTGEPFTTIWETMRTRRDRSLPLVSGPLPDLDGDMGTVTIRVTDVCGQTWWCRPSSADGNS